MEIGLEATLLKTKGMTKVNSEILVKIMEEWKEYAFDSVAAVQIINMLQRYIDGTLKMSDVKLKLKTLSEELDKGYNVKDEVKIYYLLSTLLSITGDKEAIKLFIQYIENGTILPIMCEPEEFYREEDYDVWHHISNYSIMKVGVSGKPMYTRAILFTDQNTLNSSYTATLGGIDSVQYIKTLPFIPKSFYIELDKDGKIVNPEILEEAFKYYDFRPSAPIYTDNCFDGCVDSCAVSAEY